MLFVCVSFPVLVVGFLTIGLSRMILGVHSLDQLIYGWVIGLWTLTYILIFWRPLVKSHFYKIKNKQLTSKELTRLLI